MLFLLDTNAVSDLMAENATISARLAARPESDQILTCAIVRGEILYGIERLALGKRRAELLKKANEVFDNVTCVDMVEAVGDRYSAVKRSCQAKGSSLFENDLWIAATALVVGATLVTRDSDFRNVGGLSVEDWTT